MAAVKHLIGLRNAIDDLVNATFRSNGHVTLSTDHLLREVKRKLRKQIEAAESDLIDIALKRLLDDVGRRKAGRRRQLGEKDLFAGYANIPQMVTIGDKKRKRTSTLSIREAQDYLDTHSPRAVSEQYEAFKRLVHDCLKYSSSDEDKLEDLIAKRKRALAEESKSAFPWTSKSPTSSASEQEPVLAR